MGDRGLTDVTLPVPCTVLERLLSMLPAGSEAEIRLVGHDTGVALAGQIGESARDPDPSWNATDDAWRELGLGRLSRSAPGPGLMEIVLEESGIPTGSPDFLQGLLEGLIESFVSEPVRAAAVADTIDDPEVSQFRFVVGAPELIARLRPGLDSGRSIAELMEEVWS